MAFSAVLSARLACIVGLLLLCVHISAQSTTGDVTGIVISKTTRAGIKGALVSGNGKTTVTDASGRYTLTGLATGSSFVYISSLNYMPSTLSVMVSARTQITAQPTSLSGVSELIKNPGNRIPWNGKNWYLMGNNYAWWNYGTDFGTGGWGKYTDFGQISSDLAVMSRQKVSVVRWFVFADGRYAPRFNADGTIAGLDKQFFTDVTTVLKYCYDNNIYLMPVLVDNLMWTGPRSSGPVTGGAHGAMITDPKTQMSYLENAVKPFLQFVAGSPYKKQLLAYDIANEPEYTIREVWGGGLPLRDMQTFALNCASYIHQYGGGAYATLGSGTPYWVGYWKGLGLDFYQVHYYPNFDWNGAGSGLPTYANLGLDKPCIVGEFATNDNSFAIGDITPLSAQWHLDTIYNYGYAGALGWSYQFHDYAGNWNSFVPVLTNWVNGHSAVVGPK